LGDGSGDGVGGTHIAFGRPQLPGRRFWTRPVGGGAGATACNVSTYFTSRCPWPALPLLKSRAGPLVGHALDDRPRPWPVYDWIGGGGLFFFFFVGPPKGRPGVSATRLFYRGPMPLGQRRWHQSNPGVVGRPAASRWRPTVIPGFEPVRGGALAGEGGGGARRGCCGGTDQRIPAGPVPARPCFALLSMVPGDDAARDSGASWPGGCIRRLRGDDGGTPPLTAVSRLTLSLLVIRPPPGGTDPGGGHGGSATGPQLPSIVCN